MSGLTQDDWDWLQKLAMISQLPAKYPIPSDVLLRLLEVGYVRNNKQEQIVITSVGRRAIKARDSGEDY